MLEKAHYLLKPLSLRRTKAEVETKLPPKEEIEVKVPLSEMQAFWYKRLILQVCRCAGRAPGPTALA
jgi:SNF2 family DNA or RNA helicase